ncbi:MAG: acyltransferase [Bacteroidetes bacterium]|nr:acyltransferase [Bacteroidota bacterium]
MNRLVGLDIIRATAILLVVLSHAFRFSPLSAWFQLHISPALGQIGVELFFALSGFLIGRILIRETDSSVSSLNPLHFWGRRWMRTLPAYYFALLLFPLLNRLLHNQPFPEISSYFVFTQNLCTPHPEYFGIAWSLSVEEWAYLFTPLGLIIIGKTSRLSGQNSLLRYSLLLISAGTMIRFFHPALHSAEAGSWDALVRKIVLYRLDAIGYGLLAAAIPIKNISTKQLAAISFSLMSGATLVYLLGGGTSDSINYYTCILLLPLTGMGFASFVLLASRMQTTRKSTIISVVRFVSIVSYSLYLVHSHLWEYTLSVFPENPPAAIAWSYFVGYCICSVLLAYLLYRGIEKPLLMLRDKYLP